MLKIFLIITGWLAVSIGTVGIFLPILPTTPFMLLAAGCFAKSSEKFHRWLLGSPVFGSIIRDWQEQRGIRLGTKCWAMFVVVLTFSISIYIVNIQIIRIFLFGMMMVSLVFIVRLPVIPSSKAKLK